MNKLIHSCIYTNTLYINNTIKKSLSSLTLTYHHNVHPSSYSTNTLNQSNNNPVNMIAQIILMFGGLNGFFSDITLDWISTFERKLLYFLNDADIFSILNVIGRDEMPEDLMAFFINLMKVYLSNEESIY